jgi:hypothetical protein
MKRDDYFYFSVYIRHGKIAALQLIFDDFETFLSLGVKIVQFFTQKASKMT